MNYIKVYCILLVLLASASRARCSASMADADHRVRHRGGKAYLVAANFMHLNVEKKYVVYLLLTALAFMFLFYAGVSPDVMQHRGRHWENVAAQEWSKKALAEDAAEREHGEHEEH